MCGFSVNWCCRTHKTYTVNYCLLLLHGFLPTESAAVSSFDSVEPDGSVSNTSNYNIKFNTTRLLIKDWLVENNIIILFRVLLVPECPASMRNAPPSFLLRASNTWKAANMQNYHNILHVTTISSWQMNAIWMHNQYLGTFSGCLMGKKSKVRHA